MEIKEILKHVDHTLLLQPSTWEEIRQICDDAMKYGTASVCIPPCYVKQAAEYMAGKMTVCTVIGFPNGYMTTAAKEFETKDALAKTKIGSWEYDIIEPAYKCNMTDIMAAIGLGQLSRYEDLLNYRKSIINRYDELLKDVEGVEVLKHYDNENISSGHLYLVRLVGKDEAFSNEVITKMAEAGIATNVHYKPLPMLTAYKNLGFKIEDYPNAFDMYKNEITLPLNTLISLDQVEYVVNTLKSTLNKHLAEDILCL